jgi:hypothetical protein
MQQVNGCCSAYNFRVFLVSHRTLDNLDLISIQIVSEFLGHFHQLLRAAVVFQILTLTIICETNHEESGESDNRCEETWMAYLASAHNEASVLSPSCFHRRDAEKNKLKNSVLSAPLW